MMPLMVDSHAHLDDTAFDHDREAMLERAARAGITGMVVPAVDQPSWQRISDLCRQHPELAPAYGLHPVYLASHLPEHVDALSRWLEREPAVAVGEIGLDFHDESLEPSSQRDYFVRQLKLARERQLPVIVHAREAMEEVILTMRRIDGLRGVVHSFSGSEQQAAQLWRMGFCLGIGGPVTYARAMRLRRIVATMPLDFLMRERDAPDPPDAGQRGERNEPARVVDVLHCIAALRDQPSAAIAAATSANAARLFGISLPVA